MLELGARIEPGQGLCIPKTSALGGRCFALEVPQAALIFFSGSMLANIRKEPGLCTLQITLAGWEGCDR